MVLQGVSTKMNGYAIAGDDFLQSYNNQLEDQAENTDDKLQNTYLHCMQYHQQQEFVYLTRVDFG